MRKWLLVVFIVTAAILAATLGYYFHARAQEIAAIKATDRTGQILVQNNRADEGDYPFILEAKIASETSSQLIVNVQYFMSETIGGEYSFSIHPDTSDWSYGMNTLRPGVNVETIVVTFAPQPATKKRSQSKLLHLYINRSENNQYKGKVFDRTVDFSKIWMN